jgi:predicted MFS family arabinose efflux permease
VEVAARATGRARTLLGFAALGLFWGAWGAELPAVKQHSGASDAELGAALFCIGGGALLAMRPAGVLVDRGGRWVLPALAAVFAGCGFLPAVAGSPLALAGVLVLVGATSGSLDVAINSEGVRSEAVDRPVLRLAHGTYSATAVAAALLAGGVRGAGASVAGVLGMAAGLVLAAGLLAACLEPAPRGAEHPPALRELLRAPRPLVILGALCALAFFVEGAWQNWSAVHLDTTLGAGATLAAVGPALFAGAMAAGRIGGQSLAVDERRLLASAAALSAAGTLLAALAPGRALALAGIALAGLGISVCAPLLIAMAGGISAPDRRGSAVSVVTTVAYLGFVVGPAAVGLLAQGIGLRASLASVAGLAVALGVLARHAPGPGGGPGSDARAAGRLQQQ